MRISPLTAVAATAAGILALRAAVRALTRSNMQGRVVFVNGASRGLGLAIAAECARRGASVAITARDAAHLEAARRSLQEITPHVLALRCDARERGEIASAIEQAQRHFGRLDVLVNVLGTIVVGPMSAMTREDYQDALDTHFWALYYAVEAALPHLERSDDAHITNVTSIGGKVSVPHLLPYSVSKFAAVGYSEGLRAELAPRGIGVTTVCPGLMRTGSPRNAWFKAQHRKEYAWFTLSDTLPGLSVPASAAAAQIVDATLQGRPELVISLPARAAALLHGVFPGLTARALGIGARLLPQNGGVESRRMRGWESESPLTQSPLTVLGRHAERQFNQL